MLLRRNKDRRQCKRYGWSPLLDSGLLIWLLAGSGYTLDGDGKVMYWDGMGGGARVTFTTRPTPVSSDANYAGRPSLNLAGGCYGTCTLTSSTSRTVRCIGHKPTGENSAFVRGSNQLVCGMFSWIGPNYYWSIYEGTNMLSSRACTLPSIMIGRYNGESSKFYVHARTPMSGDIGAGGALVTLVVGATLGGLTLWNGTMVDICITQTKTDANDSLLLAQAEQYTGLTLGA